MMNWHHINPRRRWIKQRFGDEINKMERSAIPAAYSVDDVYLRYRQAGTPASSKSCTNSTEPAKTGSTDQASNPNTSTYAGVAAEAMGIYGVGIFEKLQSVDDHVYEAMSRLASNNISTFADLSQSLGDYKHDFFVDISDKALDKWKGHLAETYAAEHLSDGGHDVIWPDASNQKGWDLLVDGHEVNVKLVSDISSLQHHFDLYPDVAVLVPSDLALGTMSDGAFIFDPTNSIDGALTEYLASSESHKIIVDNALSAAAVKDHALDAADIAIGGSASVDAHIPWVTVATAGWREMKLLDSGSTDWKSAGKNLTADVVGRGGGALAGGKAGAVLGTYVAPGVGTAIGGLIGAIGGAIIGAMGSNKFKRIELQEALDSAIEAEKELAAHQLWLQRKSESDFKSEKVKQADLLNKLRSAEQSNIGNAKNKIRNKQKQQKNFSTNDAQKWLTAARNAIEAQAAKPKAELLSYGFWKRWIWPDMKVVAAEEILAEFERMEKKLSVDPAQLTRGKHTIPSATVLKLVSETGVLRERTEEYLQRLEEARRRNEALYREQIDRSCGNVIMQRQKAFSELSDLANKLSTHVRESLKPKLKNLEERICSVEIEKAKLGIA